MATTTRPTNGSWMILAAAVVVGVVPGGNALAHEGPPYPILVDQQTPGYVISVWADPDVGTGTFYVIAEPAGPESRGEVPRVDVWVEPAGGRLPRQSYRAARQDIAGRIQLLAEPYFDRRGPWTIGVVVHQPGGRTSELVTDVEVTPPGGGPWILLAYLFPFFLFGGMWAVALIRRWRAQAVLSKESTPRAGTPKEA